MEKLDKFYSVAPMMGKTDSFFCYLLNLINKKTVVYTEMMHAEAIIRTNILDDYNYLNNINNVAIQIAGNEPSRLALAAKKAAEKDFYEININCGCPSNRVVSGSFGINLLLNPKQVRRCAEEISRYTNKNISIKTRIGVDDYTSENILDNFLVELNNASINKYIIHARIAIREKLNTKDNLNIPPLDYERVFKLKKKFKNNTIIINGGFKHTNYNENIKRKIDGIMIGREAYKTPWIFNSDLTYENIEKKKYIIYTYIHFLKNNFEKYLFKKNALFHIQNLFNGYDGAKNWRNLVAHSVRSKNLNNLLNFIECDKLKVI